MGKLAAQSLFQNTKLNRAEDVVRCEAPGFNFHTRMENENEKLISRYLDIKDDKDTAKQS